MWWCPALSFFVPPPLLLPPIAPPASFAYTPDMAANTKTPLSPADRTAQDFTYRLRHEDPKYNGQLAKITNLVGITGGNGYPNARIQLLDAVGTILVVPRTQLTALPNTAPAAKMPAPTRSPGWTVPPPAASRR